MQKSPAWACGASEDLTNRLPTKTVNPEKKEISSMAGATFNTDAALAQEQFNLSVDGPSPDNLIEL
jgi:hypothetical protein